MPELSLIVPVLNDAAELCALARDLERQRGCAFELVVVDGGSTDGAREQLAELAPSFPLRWLETPPGRGRQFNAGVRAATADWLLLLHADSRLPDPQALATALATLARCDQCRTAGRFSLCFREGDGSAFWHLLASKARGGRPFTIHGDQGWLLHHSFWDRLGGFDETLPVLEDTLFAERLRWEGEWLLLPPELVTSARRFLVEGAGPRQTLNALIIAFGAIGWHDWLRQAPGLYRQQNAAGRLALWPFCRLVWRLLAALPWRERCRLWWATGGFVRGQAWQVGCWFDSRRRWQQGLPPAGEAGPAVRWIDRYFEPATANGLGQALATLLTLAGFILLSLVSALRRA